MISYTFTEIFNSLLSALVFGSVFSLFCSICRLARLYFGMLLSALYGSVVYDGKLFSRPDLNRFERRHRESRLISEISAFFSVVLFFWGIILISYLTLDGDVRIYLVIFAFLAFLISERLFSRFFIKILCFGFELILFSFTVILRIIILPFKIIFSFLSKIVRKNSILTKITPFTTLDKQSK